MHILGHVPLRHGRKIVAELSTKELSEFLGLVAELERGREQEMRNFLRLANISEYGTPEEGARSFSVDITILIFPAFEGSVEAHRKLLNHLNINTTP